MEARLPFSQILQGHYHASLGHPWRWKAHFEPNAASGVFRADRRMSLVMRTMKAVPKSGISKLAIGTARSAAMKSPAPNKRTLFIFRNRRTSVKWKMSCGCKFKISTPGQIGVRGKEYRDVNAWNKQQQKRGKVDGECESGKFD
jgi:hypothetical protein